MPLAMIDLRRKLAESLLHPLQGITFSTWLRLLKQNRFDVDVPYWPRAALITLSSIANSAGALADDLRFGRSARAATPDVEPVFILGHYRSGTTFLYRLFCQDDRFAFPTVYQTYFPKTFLCTEALLRPFASLVLMRNRAQDQLEMKVDSPADDESALCTSTLLSPYLGQAFPRNRPYYDRYLTFDGVTGPEFERWRDALLEFTTRLTSRRTAPLLLKSPPHTARVNLLLKVFPRARFVHIQRDPFAVYQSTKRLFEEIMPIWRLQATPRDFDFHNYVLDTYEKICGRYLDDRGLVPRGQLFEIAFEALEEDPVGQLAACYDSLNLPNFGPFECRLRDYLASISGHVKSSKPEKLDEPTRRSIERRWARFFHAWNYES